MEEACPVSNVRNAICFLSFTPFKPTTVMPRLFLLPIQTVIFILNPVCYSTNPVCYSIHRKPLRTTLRPAFSLGLKAVLFYYFRPMSHAVRSEIGICCYFC